MPTLSSRCFLASLLLVPCLAQEGSPAPTPVAPATKAEPAPAAVAPQQQNAPHFLVRRYPQDKDVPVAIVGSRTITLGDLVDHIDTRHYPGFKAALATQPHVQRYLQSDLIAPWVRYYADLEALRQTFEKEIDAAKLEQAQSDALKSSFKGWLETYLNDRKQNGRPLELTQDQINSRLSDFQLKHGIASELQGMLDLLEPGEFNRVQLQNFYNVNARAFGGQVTVEHILIQHRDAGTGILLNEEGIGRANARLADIRARLRPDGSNFEEVALRSDDQRTGKDGGKLGGLHRFDDRMPASLCRAAWSLQDGQISEPVESQYGWHILKRIEFNQNIIVLFTDDAIPTIRKVMRRALQEERLFTARSKSGLRLML